MDLGQYKVLVLGRTPPVIHIHSPRLHRVEASAQFWAPANVATNGNNVNPLEHVMLPRHASTHLRAGLCGRLMALGHHHNCQESWALEPQFLTRPEQTPLDKAKSNFQTKSTTAKRARLDPSQLPARNWDIIFYKRPIAQQVTHKTNVLRQTVRRRP